MEMLEEYKPDGFIQMGVLLLSIILLFLGAVLLFGSATGRQLYRMLGASLMMFGGMYALTMKKIENPNTFTITFFGIALFALAMIDSAVNYN